jgi:hypothetical protein
MMASLNMAPRAPTLDGFYCGPGHAKLFCDLGLRDALGQKTSDYRYVGLCQLYLVVVRAAWGICAPLVPPVAHIVRLRTQKQMRRIAAWRVIAAVQHEEVARDWPVSDLLCNSVGVQRSVVERKQAVPVRCFAANPGPTAICQTASVDLAPEALNRKCLRRQFGRTKALHALAVKTAQFIARKGLALALRRSTLLERSIDRQYGAISHSGNSPSRCGQGRRLVCSERRSAFVPLLATGGK